MVKIINAHLRKGDRGEFVSLELQGDLVMLQSQTTGKFYATAKRCFITSTFDLATATALIGQQIPGTIVRMQCNPYDFTNKETGEVMKLTHTYAYVPHEGAMPQYEPQQAPVMETA